MGKHGGTVVSTTALQQEGPKFNSTIRCVLYMFSLCLCRFTPVALASKEIAASGDRLL